MGAVELAKTGTDIVEYTQRLLELPGVGELIREMHSSGDHVSTGDMGEFFDSVKQDVLRAMASIEERTLSSECPAPEPGPDERPTPRRLNDREQRDLLRLFDAKERVRELQGRPITDYLRDHFAAEHAGLAELVLAAKDFVRGGEHDGPCNTEHGACDMHWETAKARRARLQSALDALKSDGPLQFFLLLPPGCTGPHEYDGLWAVKDASGANFVWGATHPVAAIRSSWNQFLKTHGVTVYSRLRTDPSEE